MDSHEVWFYEWNMFSSLAFAVDVKAEANEVSMYSEWVGEIQCDYQQLWASIQAPTTRQ